MPAKKPRDPSRPVHEAAMKRGNDHMQKRQYEEAIVAYSEAIEFFPGRAVTYLLRAVAYDRIGEHEKAEVDRKAVDQLPPS